MILAGDLGGTKTVLALFDGDASAAPVREQSFQSGHARSLDAIVAEFLTTPSPSPITAACFGVAGRVTNNPEGATATITNLPWTIDARTLSTQLGGASVELLNDLQTTALGMRVLPDSAFAVLQPGDRPAGATIAVIAPGTGLGEATLVADPATGNYRALPSEGGHADFAPTTDDEVELWRFLHARYGHVSLERILSGKGLGEVYDHLRARSGAPEPAWLADAIKDGDKAAAVSDAGLAAKDEVAARALDMFAEILGAEAGNQALRMLATGGVVLGGGIPPKILPALQRGTLIARFNDKGRFAPFTRTLPVRVALDAKASLLGAADFASHIVPQPQKDRA